MKINIGSLLIAVALLALTAPVRGQEPTPTPKSAKDKAKVAAATATATMAAPAPAATPDQDPWRREEMTGNWGGDRDRWKAKGFEVEASLTGFFQGTAVGGLKRESEWNGAFKIRFKFDLGKLAGWKWWSAEIGTDTRFGGNVLTGVGTINPVNTGTFIPSASGNVFTIGTVAVTRLFPIDLKKGNLIAVSVGRYNILDLSDEDFFGGSGIDRFWNIAQIGPLTVLRQVPLMTNLGSIAYVRHGEPFITFALLDPNDHSLDPGLKNLFADGVTFMPGINFSSKWWGKTGKHSFGAAVTTKKYTPFDALRQIIIPGPPINQIPAKGGSWSFNYTGRQYFVEREKRDGWGAFWQFSYADKATSPITTFFSGGLGGNGLFKNRRTDEFGLSYAYTGLSDVLKDNIDLVTQGGRRPRAEHQVEAFYNFHITPWLRFTPDIQFIRPTRAIADFAIVPGARLEVIF